MNGRLSASTAPARGAREAAKALRDFAANIGEATEEDLKKLAPLALERANSLTPVRTGYLRSRNRAGAEGKKLTLANDAPYASHVEFGTSRQEPQPFIGPVRAELEQSAPGIIKQGLAKAWDKAKKDNATL